MVVSFLLTTFFGIVSGLVGLLPSWSWPSAAGDGAMVGSFAQFANTVFPVDQLALAAAAGLAFSLVLASVNLGVWVFHQFWGSD